MKPSQLIARKDIDREYDRLHDENETLCAEKAAIAQALEGLLNERSDETREAARQVLDTLEV